MQESRARILNASEARLLASVPAGLVLDAIAADAGISATLGRDSAHLEKVREHFARWQPRLDEDGIDPNTATLVSLAADGLWLSALLGLPQLAPESSADVIRVLRDLTRNGSG